MKKKKKKKKTIKNKINKNWKRTWNNALYRVYILGHKK